MWLSAGRDERCLALERRTTVNERTVLASALRRGFVRAIVLERTFTDLIAPYGIAAIALIVCACSALAPHL